MLPRFLDPLLHARLSYRTATPEATTRLTVGILTLRNLPPRLPRIVVEIGLAIARVFSTENRVARCCGVSRSPRA